MEGERFNNWLGLQPKYIYEEETKRAWELKTKNELEKLLKEHVATRKWIVELVW